MPLPRYPCLLLAHHPSRSMYRIVVSAPSSGPVKLCGKPSLVVVRSPIWHVIPFWIEKKSDLSFGESVRLDAICGITVTRWLKPPESKNRFAQNGSSDPLCAERQLRPARVPSRRPIVTKFSGLVQTVRGSPPAKFGERGSSDADAVRYAPNGRSALC